MAPESEENLVSAFNAAYIDFAIRVDLWADALKESCILAL